MSELIPHRRGQIVPLATARTTSDSLSIPIRTSPSSTGRHPIFRSTINCAADLTGVSGAVVTTSGVMASFTRMEFSVRSRVVVPKPRARTRALKKRSRWLRIPTTRPLSSITGRCRIRSLRMVLSASASVSLGLKSLDRLTHEVSDVSIRIHGDGSDVLRQQKGMMRSRSGAAFTRPAAREPDCGSA